MKKIGTDRKCEEPLSQLTAMTDEGDLSDAACIRLISQYPGCADVITAQYDLWRELDHLTVPEPSASMDARFYKFLNDAQMEQERKPWWLGLMTRFNQWILRLHPGFRWAMVAGVFVIGMLVGHLGWKGQHVNGGFAGTNLTGHETTETDQHMILAHFVENQSASSRLKEVQSVKQMQDPDERIFTALNQVLLHDPSDNVRVSAIESLLLFADRPQVRKYLVEAIPFQDSPWVLVALADAMILLEEKQSAQNWKMLLESGQVEMDVKMQLEETLKPIL